MMLDRIYDLYEELERKYVMISFKGDLTGDLVTALMTLVERKLVAIERDHTMRKRLFAVVLECMQNLYHHNAKVQMNHGRPQATEDPHGIVMILRSEQGYSVLTGNFMATAEVAELKAHLDRINELAPDKLRELYRERLNNGQYTASGGGGLGMIDIARKSNSKLEYGFVPIGQDNAFFSLNVNVTT